MISYRYIYLYIYIFISICFIVIIIIIIFSIYYFYVIIIIIIIITIIIILVSLFGPLFSGPQPSFLHLISNSIHNVISLSLWPNVGSDNLVLDPLSPFGSFLYFSHTLMFSPNLPVTTRSLHEPLVTVSCILTYHSHIHV